MTDTTGLDLNKHLGTDRVRADGLGPFERLAILSELIADHAWLQAAKDPCLPSGFGLQAL